RSKAQALRTFRMTRSRAPTTGASVAVFLLEPARRPVVVRRVATAGTVERGDVLQGNENVSVQLDVSDVFHVAIGRQDTFLVLTAEKRDLDLLALVLVRVVLHRFEPSGLPRREAERPWCHSEKLPRSDVRRLPPCRTGNRLHTRRCGRGSSDASAG